MPSSLDERGTRLFFIIYNFTRVFLLLLLFFVSIFVLFGAETLVTSTDERERKEFWTGNTTIRTSSVSDR